MKPSLIALTLGLGLATLALPAYAATDTDGDGIPDKAEALLGTDPLVADTDGDGTSDKADDKPLEMANPIAQGGKPGGLKIVAGIVENNVDAATKKDADDHIELDLKNTSGDDISGVEVFIAMTDDMSGAVENSYRKLAAMKIGKGATGKLHFDIKGSPDFAAATDHFRANPNSALYKSPNPKTLVVQVSAPGFAPAEIVIKKDKGGAETAD
jgi:Bacterial TSP3 repeat